MTRREPSVKHIHHAALSIQQAIDKDPLSRKNIAELVPDIHVGRNQLQAVFKQLTKQTIKRYRLIKRMEAARGMLVAGVDSVKGVALQCGYRYQGNFNTDFKNVFGETPGEWLKANMKTGYNGDVADNKVHST